MIVQIKPHPAIYWAKFYLSRRTHSHEQIIGLLNVNDLPGLTAGDLVALEAEMVYPRPYKPRARGHMTTVRFLQREGIYDAWRNDSDMQMAKDILTSNVLRQNVETFILSPIKPDQACRKIRQELDISITTRAYELFEHYFWNKGLLTGLEWGDFIQTRTRANKELLALAVEAKGASGAQLLLWRMGMSGLRQVEANRGFTDIRNISFMMLHQIATMPPSKGHSEMWLNYLRAAKLAQDAIDASADAIEDVVESFNAFKMRHEESQAPSIKELTGGTYTAAENADEHEEGMHY